MSKIAEEKAFKEYPREIKWIGNQWNGSPEDINIEKRYGYIVGYDQAMQDIEEFFYDRFNIHPHDCHVIQYVSDTPLETIDDFVKQIKNYMQNESKDKENW